jgi:hypothetical protein
VKKAVSSISFLSICIAYTIGLIFFAVQQVLSNGKVDDFGVIIFWSGLFELLAWVVFLRIPLVRLNHRLPIFNKSIFPLVSTLYAEVVFIILIGWLFLQSDFYEVFVITAVVGFAFGLTYILLINNKRVVEFFNGNIWKRLTVLVYPIGFLFIFLWLFPKIMPSVAFRFMPDEIQDKIVEQTIPKFKVGDDFKPLKEALPGYFDHIENGNGNSAATLTGFAYVIQVNCGRIIRLVYSKDRNMGMTIYGSFNEKPCP